MAPLNQYRPHSTQPDLLLVIHLGAALVLPAPRRLLERRLELRDLRTERDGTSEVGALEWRKKTSERDGTSELACGGDGMEERDVRESPHARAQAGTHPLPYIQRVALLTSASPPLYTESGPADEHAAMFAPHRILGVGRCCIERSFCPLQPPPQGLVHLDLCVCVWITV